MGGGSWAVLFRCRGVDGAFRRAVKPFMEAVKACTRVVKACGTVVEALTMASHGPEAHATDPF